MDESIPQPPRFSFEDELKAERRKNIESDATIDELKAKVKSLTEQNSRLRKKEPEQSEPKPEVMAPPQSAPAATPAPAPAVPQAPTHSMSITDAYCPTCGETNPQFKDETECKECGHALGAIETLAQVKNCPGCGASGKIARKKAKGGLKITEALKI